MKRIISLYIGDELAELDDQSFILFNWAMEDLSNPTIVKNSYSQQITLQGTPQNNRIFGEYFRLDRKVLYSSAESYTGPLFDPSRKTPFTIYNEKSEVLVSGYVKLNSVVRSGGTVRYAVTLYGGLGSFFFALSYDDEGNKRTLADLDYLGTDNPDGELDFNITAATVQEAWDNLGLGSDEPNPRKWGVVNFAPAYNGIPDGEFSPDKAVALVDNLGLADNITEDDETYRSQGGYTIIDLGQDYDEWAVKDMRSYLQRPIFSIKAFFDAICNPKNNGGFSVDISGLQKDDGRAFFRNMWMTLPLLTELNLADTEIEASLSSSSMPTTTGELGAFFISSSEAIPANAKVSVSVKFNIEYTVTNVEEDRLRLNTTRTGTNFGTTAIFLQLVAISNGVAVGGSQVKCLYYASSFSPQGLAELCKFIPEYNADGIFESNTVTSSFDRLDGLIFRSQDIKMSCEATGATQFILFVSCQQFTVTYVASQGLVTKPRGSMTNMPTLYEVRAGGDYSHTPKNGHFVTLPTSNTVTVSVEDAEIRSNAHITKSVLLSTEHTPAEYLLSFCKMYGLHFLYDSVEKSVSIVSRNTLYSKYAEDSDIIDLTGRIDLSQDIEIVPFVFESKWYDFLLECDGGEFYDNYKTQYGKDYGMQRVDTGYEFEADNIGVLDGNVFRNAVTVLEKGPYFNTIKNGTQFVPSVFVDKGKTYTLWTAEGDSKDFDIATPPKNANVTYLNEYGNEGYDVEFSRKLQLHDDEDKPLDGSNILVYYSGMDSYPYFKLSDDSALMISLNDGKPCWDITPGEAEGIGVPVFGRYDYNEWIITESFDFGMVREFAIPTVYYYDDVTIYSLYWKKYLSDRYDVNSRILRCRVDLSGLPVGQELLRRFWWYDNALWVLNSITNYSMTTYDSAECEFIQVQDKDNYTQGQTIK